MNKIKKWGNRILRGMCPWNKQIGLEKTKKQYHHDKIETTEESYTPYMSYLSHQIREKKQN